MWGGLACEFITRASFNEHARLISDDLILNDH